MVHAARASTARATALPSTRHLLIGRTAIRIARNSPENNALNFSNRPKRACLRAPFSHVLRSKNHDSPVTCHASRFTDHQSLLTNHAFLIATRPELKIELTHSQQTRKLFLIATFSAISAPAPRLANQVSRRTAPFLFDTNKIHKINNLMKALMKTKEKQFSIRYKFALRSTGLPAVRRQDCLCYRDSFCFFEFFDQGGDDFEEVAYYAVIGNFEDGGILILVDGGDGAGAFHADYVLDGAADA